MVSRVVNLGAGRTKKSWLDCRQKGTFLSSKFLDRLWGPPSLIFNGQRDCFCRGKWPVGRVYLSVPSIIEVKNWWSSASTPPYAFTVCIGTTVLTRCTRVLLKKLRFLQLVTIHPAFLCLLLFTVSRYWCPSWARGIHSTCRNHFCNHMLTFSFPSSAPGVNCCLKFCLCRLK